MSWGGVRGPPSSRSTPRAARRGPKGARLQSRIGGDKTAFPGNIVEADARQGLRRRLARAPRIRQRIRDAVPTAVAVDYGEPDGKRVVILPEPERDQRRAAARPALHRTDSAPPPSRPRRCRNCTSPPAGSRFPRPRSALHAGTRTGRSAWVTLLAAPGWEQWRDATFPDRDRPTGEILDLLPSPRRKPRGTRAHRLSAQPDGRAGAERTPQGRQQPHRPLWQARPHPRRTARQIGLSKREREERQAGMRNKERERAKAKTDLDVQGPARTFSRRHRKMAALAGMRQVLTPTRASGSASTSCSAASVFQVEHIWPRSKSLDDSARQQDPVPATTGTPKDNRTPFEAFRPRRRLARHEGPHLEDASDRTPHVPGKAKRFCAEEPMPDDFAARQFNDTGYAARSAVALLKRLWPDLGPTAPVTVQAVSGRVTAQLRQLWQLNNILSRRRREDPRRPPPPRHGRAGRRLRPSGGTQLALPLFRPRTATTPRLRPKPSFDAEPWPSIRSAAEAAVAAIVVSHRVRKKVSGPLHKETTYGDTGRDVATKDWPPTACSSLARRSSALTKGELERIVDPDVRRIVQAWVAAHGAIPRRPCPPIRAFRRRRPEIRKVRLPITQQLKPDGAGFDRLSPTSATTTTSPSTAARTASPTSRSSACSRLPAPRPPGADRAPSNAATVGPS